MLMTSANEEYLSFHQNEQLTFDELESLITDISPIDRARLIANKLSQRIIVNHGETYLYIDKTVSYKKIHYDNRSLHEYLLMITRILIIQSYKSLSEEQKDLLALRHEKKIGAHCSKLFPPTTTRTTSSTLSIC